MEESWRDPGALARRYASAVYRLAYARTGSRADAEDVMQEVFLRLLKARPVFSSQDHAKAWLLRVAANCANDLFRLPWRRGGVGSLQHLEIRGAGGCGGNRVPPPDGGVYSRGLKKTAGSGGVHATGPRSILGGFR